MSVALPSWCAPGPDGRPTAVRVVDLSHPLTASTPVYPGDPEPRIFTATTVANEGYNLSHVHLGTQAGNLAGCDGAPVRAVALEPE